jgi:hypothetical protein
MQRGGDLHCPLPESLADVEMVAWLERHGLCDSYFIS